ncbi:uncharacterized protein LOC142893532 isoform X2 [Nelusetta ayraudi]|uniref:uncharacterized protein LOC142893532 isoform X2 n=1 Tax=Nelusetta ayraudi TaxID=303726 RepID=UPI003F728990
MTLWSHICLLVLATSSRSRGQDGPSGVGHKPDGIRSLAKGSTESPTKDGDQNYTLSTPQGFSVTQSPTMDNQTEPTAPDTKTEGTREGDGNSTATTIVVTSVSTGRSVAFVTTDVSKATSPSKKGVSVDESSESQSSGGYVILVLIIALIVGLCVILYLLRRSSRTYSFDLQRPLPVNYQNEPTGTFEAVHLDDLEPPVQFDDVATDDLSPPSVGNGTTAQSEESGSNGLKSPVEQQDVNGLETLPISPPASDQLVVCPLDSVTLLSSGASEEEQNENNNHPFCPSDLFVDININEPTWSDLPLK